GRCHGNRCSGIHGDLGTPAGSSADNSRPPGLRVNHVGSTGDDSGDIVNHTCLRSGSRGGRRCAHSSSRGLRCHRGSHGARRCHAGRRRGTGIHGGGVERSRACTHQLARVLLGAAPMAVVVVLKLGVGMTKRNGN
ncbi:unnamed protein product, partial [Pylaiella littoralis]